jgi:hypothetical protein
MLPANKPRRFDIELKYKPREMHPVYYDSSDWSITLEALDINIIRETGIKCVETPEARENLQTWVDNMGPALYNPVVYRPLDTPYPWKYGSRSGGHRVRALEALDFNFMYVYLIRGEEPSTIPRRVRIDMDNNNKSPIVSARSPKCEVCGGITSTKRIVDRSFGKRHIKCLKCGHTYSIPLVYPEPV